MSKLGLDQTLLADTADTAAGGDTDLADETGETADEPAPVAVSLAGRAWGIHPGTLTVVRPAGLDEMIRGSIDRNVLVYAASQSETTVDLLATVANASGNQNPCEDVRPLPTGTWANPRFAVRSGEVEVSFRGARATLHEVELTGVVSPLADRWTDGTMRAVLDLREVEATLGEDDVCAMVAGLGGDCDLCSDGEQRCVQLEMAGVEGEALTGAFDPTVDSDAC